MKLFRYAYIITSILLLFSCNLKNTEKDNENASTLGTEILDVEAEDTYAIKNTAESEDDSLENDPDFERYSFRKATNDFFESKLRPNEKLYTNVEYTDTVEYVDRNNEFDYSMISIKKNDTELTFLDGLVYDVGDTLPTFQEGDRLEIVWQMDSMWIAGDGESLWIDEWITQIRKID